MKKILSLAMALVMMMAVAVPAFAAIQYEDTGAAGTETIINTDTKKDTDGNGEGDTEAAWFTVTIPATQTLPWEATSSNIKYTVASQLKTGEAVKVTVDDADKVYKMTAAGGELKYSLENETFIAPTAVYDAETSVTVKVALNDWKSVAIDNYTDTLTFTAEIV